MREKDVNRNKNNRLIEKMVENIGNRQVIDVDKNFRN